MNDDIVLEITRTELHTLKEFLKVLTNERDAIVSFSLEGIVRENNRKEEILKRLEFLENEKEKQLDGNSLPDLVVNSGSFQSMKREIDRVMDEVRIGLEKNMKLLTFSMDHVKTSIEKVITFINKATYGRKREKVSLLLSREA